MDYEKKYKEALERARKFRLPEDLIITEDIFPELKESEDERIRKHLISRIRDLGFGDDLFDAINTKGDILSWLEKQGEQKPDDKIEPKFKVGDVIRHKKQGFTCKIIGIDTEYRLSECNGTHLPIEWQDAYELVEQEHDDKVEDKVEQKFRVGDWIVEPRDGEPDGLWHIDRIEDGNYWSDKCGCTIEYADKNFHLWTIQDAKDGDVLVSKNAVFIFKHMDKAGLSLCKSYCEVIGNSGLGFGFDFSINGVYPATKEQRDLLFQKMKEEGYEWDAKKKELKKIEQSSAWNEEEFGINGLHAAIDILQKTLGKVEGYQSDDGILEHKCAISALKQLAEKNPSWSEEDEKIINGICNYLMCSDSPEGYTEWIDLLQSLKYRISQPHWKPSKEQLRSLINSVQGLYQCKEKEILLNLYEQLKIL